MSWALTSLKLSMVIDRSLLPEEPVALIWRITRTNSPVMPLSSTWRSENLRISVPMLDVRGSPKVASPGSIALT